MDLDPREYDAFYRAVAPWRDIAPPRGTLIVEVLPGNAIVGPCVVETATTSMVVHPNQRIAVDALGNFLIDPNWV